MLVNAAMRVLPPNQKKLFVTKIVKEEFASKLIDGAMSLEDIAVNVSFHKKFLLILCSILYKQS